MTLIQALRMKIPLRRNKEYRWCVPMIGGDHGIGYMMPFGDLPVRRFLSYEDILAEDWEVLEDDEKLISQR